MSRKWLLVDDAFTLDCSMLPSTRRSDDDRREKIPRLQPMLCCFVRRVGLVGRALDSGSGGSRFESWRRHFLTRDFLGRRIHSHCSGQLSLNRVPASAGVRAGMIASVGWQVTLCDPIGMRVPIAVRCLHYLLYTPRRQGDAVRTDRQRNK